jgi:hypothetical protein
MDRSPSSCTTRHAERFAAGDGRSRAPTVVRRMPVGIGPRFKYQDVIARIRAGGGEWVKVGLEEISTLQSG